MRLAQETHRQALRLHTSAVVLNTQQELRDAEITQAIAQLSALLDNSAASAVEIWAKYDYLKIRRIVAFIPFEMWAGLFKACQQRPADPKRASWSPKERSKSTAAKDGTGRRRSKKPETDSEDGSDSLGRSWTRTMAKRRALMVLGDMWRCFSPDSAQGAVGGDSYTVWRPSTFHYNVVFDVICRDTSSSVDELLWLHRDMRLHSVQEDAVTFNTLLNGCRRLGAWGFFREIEEQISRRDEWGITRMDATTWGTLIQGYMQCQDWESVDRCVAQATKACRLWSQGGATRGVRPTTELWSIIVNIYATRDMIPQMLASRSVMGGLGLSMNVYTFGPVFAALHRLRKRLVRGRRDAWPAISHALSEFDAMRKAGISPNASILTNMILTVGLNNPYALDATRSDNESSVQAKILAIGGSVAQELEQILSRARDPNIYATLLNIAARTANHGEVQEIWQTLLAESAQTHHMPPQQLLTCLTLSAYMNALNACKMYDSAIAAFYAHAMPAPSEESGAPGGPRLQALDRSVYEAALMAFARTDRHRMCVSLIRTMISKGIQPSVLALRYTLLPPDHTVLAKRPSSTYTRRWSLPLAIARSVWSLIVEARRSAWMHSPGPSSVYADASVQQEQPVIVNDIAAQLIRIAAYARNVEFGEEVFEALNAEAAYFGQVRRDSHASEVDGGDTATRSSQFPEDLQCFPNVRTYTSMITLYGNDANLAGVGKMWESMLSNGVEPNLHTYTSLIVALHKVALRRRWRGAQLYKGQGSDAGEPRVPFASASRDSGSLPWESTQQDLVIGDIEDWIVDARPSSSSSSNDSVPSWLSRSESPSLDIPLSTLLLRYHALRIRDTLRSPEGALKEHMDAVEHSTSENIQRAMQVCHAVETAGLKPDYRFHAALADFLDTCGDASGAELVRRRMAETD
ncbi:hypothetical protein GGI03_000656 [Coemansia sp. RSA 2337]|nr:hypothetical protein IW146_006946 [Coemansia sp. RSA 922]KAJ2468992.1 hypothetical protein GGI03_000656 [Coemansia sp. RSA 2337]